ncbi:MAG: hypothetical protein ABSE44_19250 [Candidatus Sulfotelmatobacter sp.]|jgi:hypothetical protein
MSSADFVKKMQVSMKEQQDREETAVRDTLHDAKVAETGGPEKWLALKTLVAQSASEINRGLASDVGLAYSEGGLDSFTLLNRASDRSVQASFDSTNGVISCHGGTNGNFQPHVEGNELAYSWQNDAPSNALPAGVGFIGTVITVEKMSELLVSSVISL